MNLWQTYLHKISIDRINIKVTKKTASFTKDFAGCIINVSEACIFPIRKKYMVQYVVYTLYGCTNLCVGVLYLFYLRGSMIHEQKNENYGW